MSQFSLAAPNALAFDFDGILCNGLKEYFQTAWRVYRQTWPETPPNPPEAIAEAFYRLRPVVEVGWEMPMVIRAVMKGIPETEVVQRWSTLKHELVQADGVSVEAIGQGVDTVRDRWIESDLDGWLGLHEFYPGVLARLKTLVDQDFPFVIITTKESRFVRQLLRQAGIELQPDQLFGKDCKQPKFATLRSLKQTLPTPIWFIEDRIATLRRVEAEADLTDIGLFLGDWGYNLPSERTEAHQDSRLQLLSLAQFTQDCSEWLSYPA